MAAEVIEEERSGKRWDQQWDRSMSSHPEAKSAKYDILVNSKSYFLYNASVNHSKQFCIQIFVNQFVYFILHVKLIK